MRWSDKGVGGEIAERRWRRTGEWRDAMKGRDCGEKTIEKNKNKKNWEKKENKRENIPLKNARCLCVCVRHVGSQLIHMQAVCQVACLHSCQSRKEPSPQFPARPPQQPGPIPSGGHIALAHLEAEALSLTPDPRQCTLRPAPSQVFNNSTPCRGLLLTLRSARSQTPARLSPSHPSPNYAATAKLRRRGGAARLHFSSLSHPLGLRAPLNKTALFKVWGWSEEMSGVGGSFPFPVYSIAFKFCIQ